MNAILCCKHGNIRFEIKTDYRKVFLLSRSFVLAAFSGLFLRDRRCGPPNDLR